MTPHDHPVLDEKKFKELVLYVAQKSVDDSTFGATKLNKILCFSDFMTYGVTGESITGAEYQKLQYGPAPRRLLPLQRELVSEGAAHLVQANYGYAQKRLVPLREADLSLFGGREIAIVDSVIEQLKNANATQVSDSSHEWFVGWDVVETYQTIPYETVFWRRPKVTSELIEEGREIARELRLV